MNLTETLIVLALMAAFVPLSLSSGIDMYDRGLARSDRTVVVAAIREARAQALSGICTAASCAANTQSVSSPSSHGVYVSTNGITLFEGSSYATRTSSADEFIPFSAPETVSGSQEIVFAGISADVYSASTSSAHDSTASPVTVVITGSDHHTETVVVNSLGSITSSSL